MLQKIIRLAAMCACVACLAIGCRENWYLSVNETDVESGRLGLCVSRLPNCHGGAAFVDDFVVEQIGSAGMSGRPVWMLHRGTASGLSYIVYGTVPSGWVETYPAEPLELNVFYAINGEYYVRINTSASGKPAVEVYTRGQFIEKFNR